MGLYPCKGAIAVGSDADITILDPARRGKISAFDLHETDYTPWEGHDIFAWPVTTILRGKVKVENGRYLASPQDGKYLKRKIRVEIRSGPARYRPFSTLTLPRDPKSTRLNSSHANSSYAAFS